MYIYTCIHRYSGNVASDTQTDTCIAVVSTLLVTVVELYSHTWHCTAYASIIIYC